MNKKITKKPAGAQNQLVEPVIKLISALKTEHSHGEVTDFNNYIQVLQEMQELNDKNLSEPIKECLGIFECCYCKRSPKYLLICKHFICDDCIKNYYNDIEFYLLNPLTFICPACKYVHSVNELKKVALEVYESVLASINEEKLQRPLELTCQKCSVPKTNSEFPKHPPCNSHKICLECLADSYLYGNFTCSTCKNPYKPKTDINKEKSICLVCQQTSYFVGDYLTSTCKSHLHCFDCLKKAHLSRRCGVCGEILNDGCIQRIDQKLYKHCQWCKNAFEAPLVIKKNCCEFNVCVFCQAKNRQNCFRCISCQQNLNSYALEMVLEVQSTIDNYVP